MKELEDLATRDKAIQKLLGDAPGLDRRGWVCCPGKVGTTACGSQLAMCPQCRRAGCFDYSSAFRGCPNVVIDHGLLCVHCATALDRQTITLTAHALATVWYRMRDAT